MLQDLQYASSQDHRRKNSQVHFPLTCMHTGTHTHLKGNPAALYKHARSDSWRTNIQEEERDEEESDEGVLLKQSWLRSSNPAPSLHS